MKIMAWNCQGLGNPLTVQALKRLNSSLSPEVMFLFETKNRVAKVDKVRSTLKFPCGLAMAAKGLRGGLSVFWKEEEQISIVLYANFFLEILVEEPKSNRKWRAIGVYASTNQNERRRQWQILTQRIKTSQQPVLVMGDFNAIIEAKEKKGGCIWNESEGRDFREFIATNGLIDLGTSGPLFTWSNRRSEPNLILERLDRGLGNPEWMDLFPKALARTIPTIGSDHLPIMIETEGWNFSSFRQRMRYDNRWSRREGRRQAVEKGWNQAGQHQPLISRIKQTVYELQKWRRKTPEANSKRMIDLYSQILKDSYEKGASMEEIKKAEDGLEENMKLEEEYWKARARIDWLQQGDRNTRYFHEKFKQRRRTNRIRGLVTTNGEWEEEPRKIKSMFVEYFSDMYKA